MHLTRKTGAVLGMAMLLAAAGALAASPASAQSVSLPASQRWLTPEPGALGPIISTSSGQCLTQDTVAGTGVPVATLQDCTGARNQRWAVTLGVGPIINRSSGQCLTQDTVAGTGVPVATLQDCTGAGNQHWSKLPGNLGPIWNAQSGLYLTQDTVAGIGLPVATLQRAG
jgi:hypothetical protein